jgi:hypothetical protein
VHGTLDRRVRAHEHQLQPPVGDGVGVEAVEVYWGVPLDVERSGALPLRRLPPVP